MTSPAPQNTWGARLAVFKLTVDRLHTLRLPYPDVLRGMLLPPFPPEYTDDQIQEMIDANYSTPATVVLAFR